MFRRRLRLRLSCKMRFARPIETRAYSALERVLVKATMHGPHVAAGETSQLQRPPVQLSESQSLSKSQGSPRRFPAQRPPVQLPELQSESRSHRLPTPLPSQAPPEQLVESQSESKSQRHPTLLP